MKISEKISELKKQRFDIVFSDKPREIKAAEEARIKEEIRKLEEQR